LDSFDDILCWWIVKRPVALDPDAVKGNTLFQKTFDYLVEVLCLQGYAPQDTYNVVFIYI